MNLVFSTSEQPEPFRSNGELAFVLYSPLKKSGAVALLAAKELSLNHAQTLVQQAERAWGFDRSHWVIKLVGKPESIQTFKSHLQDIQLAVHATSERIDSFEGLFYPAQGRLRLKVAGALPQTARKTKVLIIDDSPTIQKLLNSIFSQDPSIEVVGSILNPLEAEQAIERFQPDVITLDIHMPQMSGIEFLRKVWPKYRTPTIVITSVSREEGPLVLEALEAGAVDYVQKPTIQEVATLASHLIEKVKVVAQTSNRARESGVKASNSTAINLENIVMDERKIIAIGSSTGGTEALREVLIRLPKRIPPILIVQHIPPIFSEALAKRLNQMCPFEVREAKDGDLVVPGLVLIAPGAKQMKLRPTAKEGARYEIQITDDEPVNRHKPSVDYLFNSVQDHVGANAVGVILTGMGNDGAKGLLKMKQRRARTIAQDEASSVVFGMPKEAISLGAADEVLSLNDIPAQLIRWLKTERSAA